MATTGTTAWTLTKNQIITSALRKLVVIESGTTPTTAQLSDGTEALNSLIKAFAADGMPVWAITNTQFNTATGISIYSVGPGRTVPTVGTPLKVHQAYYIPVGGNNTPLNVTNRYDFVELPRSVTTLGSPVTLYYQPGTQYGTIYLWPTPNNSTTVIDIEYQTPFEDVTNATDNLTFPSYWMQALIYMLAWSLSPEYGIPVMDRGTLQKEAIYWKDQALSYGSEEGSLFLQPRGKY